MKTVESTNGANGIVVTGSGNRIGGPTPAARNVLSGNNFAGVALVDGEQNEVQGNLIGTNRLGTASVANLANGILI